MNTLPNLQHLKFFCDAVTYRSVSEAAKMNYVTQSAISQAISKLETQFQSSLVYHNRQKLYVTAEGEILYEKSKNIFNSVQQAVDCLEQTKQEISGTVRFLTTKSLGMSFIPPMYKRIRQEIPSIDLDFKTAGLNVIRTKLKRGEMEFAIVVYDDQFSEFEKIPLTKGRFQLHQPKGAPKELIHDGVFAYDFKGSHSGDLQHYFDTLEGDPIRLTQETSSWELTARFVDFGIGVGFFPDFLTKNNRYPNIELHPQEIPTYEYEICAIHNRTALLSKAATAFIEKFTMEE